jgi:hypothetical protein
VHYNYNYTQFSDDEENVESLKSLEKLRRNLIEEKNPSYPPEVSNFSTPLKPNNLLYKYKNFSKLPPPKNKKEVKIFVDNLLTYISEHEFDSSMLILKIKIQTRDNDYKNKGLKFDYYRDSLVKMQRELISRICMYNEEDKKVDIGIKFNFYDFNKFFIFFRRL